MQIELKGLEKTYPSRSGGQSVHAVRNVSLTIPSNTIFGIIGKSGAGKSSLVRQISLLEKPDAGEVWFGGERVDTLSGKALIDRRRRLGMIFQNFNLFSSRNAAENIAYPMEIVGKSRAEITERTAELLELVGLSDRAKSPVSTLSGGQKQRVAIARALANNPDILFCDEATSALDPQTTQSILALIRDIQKKMNLTVVMITHQMEVVRDACSNVAVIADGSVVETGSVEDIFLHPVHAATREFLSHLPRAVETEQAPLAPQASPAFVRWSESGGNYTLRFNGGLTDEPVLSRLSQRFDITFNIRAAGIQPIQQGKVGSMLVDFDGDPKTVSEAIAYLREQGIVVEQSELEAK
ncbi:MAG: ATP-binding cassette domain-containing protein [Treponema sp.]|nr:ATP-binding cassette domain-containing protein [Treponema sp.]